VAILQKPAYDGKSPGRNIDRLIQENKIRILNLEREQPKIDYPCTWVYKVIGSDFDSLKQAVSQVLQNKQYQSEESNVSSKGSYVSVKVELVVENEDIRNSIFSDLRDHDDIRMVL
jgi:uncharacterized protein